MERRSLFVRLLKWVALLAALGGIAFVLILQYYVKQEPFAPPEQYLAQEKEHKLTDDVLGHWNFGTTTLDAMAYMIPPFFDGEPFRMEKYTEWSLANRNNVEVQASMGRDFSKDADYGWPADARGMGWNYAIMSWAWAMPSVAIIEPGRTREVVYFLGAAAEMHRNPVAWMDYAPQMGWGSPLRQNVMWRGPHILLLGLYELVSGDRKRFGDEFQQMSRDLYRQHLENLALPEGKGRTPGVCCEPNQWFAQ